MKQVKSSKILKILLFIFLSHLLFSACSIDREPSPSLIIENPDFKINPDLEKIIYDYQLPYITACRTHTLIIDKNKNLWAFGQNAKGQLGLGYLDSPKSSITAGGMSVENVIYKDPVKVMGNVVYAIARDNISIILQEDGTVTIWGEGSADNMITSNQPSEKRLVEPLILPMKAKAVYGNQYDISFIAEDDSLWVFHLSARFGIQKHELRKIIDEVLQYKGGILIRKDNSLWISKGDWEYEKFMDNIIFTSSGGNHILVIDENNTLWGWGSNLRGQLGVYEQGKTIEYPVKLMDNVQKAYTHGHTTYIIKTDKTLWALGDNLRDQFMGKSNDYINPHPVQITNDVADIFFTPQICVLKTDETLYVWDSGNFWPMFENVKFVYRDYPAVIKNDDTFWVWGQDPLYDRSIEPYKPVQVIISQKE